MGYRAATEVQVSGFSGGRQKGYGSVTEAIAAWDHARASNTVGPVCSPLPASTLPCGRSQPRKLSNEEVYWVVLSGAHPGVYSGK